MTAEEKRERREVRHELQRQFKRIATRRMGLFATEMQLRASAKILADRYIALEVEKPAEEAV